MTAFELEQANGLTLVNLPELSQVPGLVHGYTTRVGGVSQAPYDSLNLSFKVSDNPAETKSVEENRLRLAKAIGYPPERLVKMDQVHGCKVLSVRGETINAGTGDALITQTRGVLLTVSIADCLPITIYDPVHKALAQVHAGWRGTLAQVGQQALLAMKEHFFTKFSDCLVGLGPCIGKCCLQVGPEVVALFQKHFPYADNLFTHPSYVNPRLDLILANVWQLRDMSVKEERIFSTGLCTSCRKDLFFSHRRDQGKAGRMIAYAGLL